MPIANFSPIAFPPELDASDITDNQLVNAFLDAYFPKDPASRLNIDHSYVCLLFWCSPRPSANLPDKAT